MDLVHERRGSGEPLLLLHGIGSRWQAWEPVLDALAARHEVWALDLPGFGASPPGTAHDVPGLTEAIRAFAAARDIDRPHVCGWSTGGGVALELAAAGAARSVCAIAPIGFWSSRERAFCQASLRNARAGASALRPVLPALVATAAGRTLLMSQIFARPWTLSPAESLGAFDAMLVASAFAETLASFTGYVAPAGAADRAPVTIAWGTRDRLLLPRQGRRARARLPKARHTTLPGCGHAAMADDPEAVAGVILAATGGQAVATPAA